MCVCVCVCVSGGGGGVMGGVVGIHSTGIRLLPIE